MIKIRKEQPADIPAIRAINEAAFRQPQEAGVVDKLRQACGGLLSLVAVVDGRTVGHVLFSPATIDSKGRTVHGMGLAPMAVLPECQRQGVPDEAFMILIFDKSAMSGVSGIARYRDEFNEAM